jgi:hypothetical protein
VQTKEPSHENPIGKNDYFFGIYEEEMPQVLENLGMSLTEYTDGPEEPQAPTSPPSNSIFDHPDIEMPSSPMRESLDVAEQPEPEFKESSPFKKQEYP